MMDSETVTFFGFDALQEDMLAAAVWALGDCLSVTAIKINYRLMLTPSGEVLVRHKDTSSLWSATMRLNQDDEWVLDPRDEWILIA